MAETRYIGAIYHFNRIYEYNGSETKCVLLAHPFYYLQNGENSIESSTDKTNRNYIEYVSAAKALLILNSAPFDYGNSNIKSFFNSKTTKNCGYEMVPYGILALMGGLLYRKRIYDEYGFDIIRTCDKYKEIGIDNMMLVKHNGKIKFGVIKKDDNSSYLPVSTLISDNIDIYVVNKLIELFKQFVDNSKIMVDSIELMLRKVITTRTETETTEKTDITKICYSDFKKILQLLYEKKSDIKELNLTLFGEKDANINNEQDTQVRLYNSDKYAVALFDNNSLLLFYKEDDIDLQLFLDKIYNHKCGVLTVMCQSNPNTTGEINKTAYKGVLNGFASTLVTLSNNYTTEQENTTDGDVDKSKNSSDDDIKQSIYMYLKQFWDKWLCGIYNDTGEKRHNPIPFTVEWFENQFLFIDSYYYDITCKLKLNCNILLELYETSKNTDGPGVHVYNHLANVAERHYCNFFCYPDFINFRKKNENGDNFTPEKIVSDLFRPIPYNQINEVEHENQFVIIRTTAAQINGDKQQFVNDSFDIWSSSDETRIAPAIFQDTSSGYDEEEPYLRMAYKVPSFGVAFSRQNNSIFKNIEIGMDTMQVTEQSIKSLCYISEFGNSNRRAISFYGNDIFGVYSAYSYIVTITMLGDAQIQPLMYFQLMNIPMFRGTYMVIDVRHSIKAGDFTTTFRGMKMSNCEPPINSSWFTIAPDESNSGEESNTSTSNCGENIVE